MHINIIYFMHRYDWVVVLDVDEVVVPRKHKSWAQMMERVGGHHILIYIYIQGWARRKGSLLLVFQQHLFP